VLLPGAANREIVASLKIMASLACRDSLTSTHNRSSRDTMLAGLCCDPTSRCSKQRSPKMHHYLHNRGTTMRTMIDVVCHALEVRWPLASAPVRWLRAARWPNVATALIVAFMAGPRATTRSGSATPCRTAVRLPPTAPLAR
jgi:hypothetical protein